MYRFLEQQLAARVLEMLRGKHPEAALPTIVIEQPPSVALGDFAIPVFPFAKPLRMAPIKIAQEIRDEIGKIDGIAGMEVAGPGYLNVRLDRAWMATSLAADRKPPLELVEGKILVEHSSINPNKAAHIGHLRNAILGDTFVRLLRYAGREVDVQNYIDNTGVQVADVVVGFLHLEKKSRAEIEHLAVQPRFDYYCWDLYARASQWYEQDRANLQARGQTLHEIEAGGNETSAIADLISVAVLRRHLETMDRLDIEYDFLPRESEILHLHFWDAAFEKLKASGAIQYATTGKNAGCWIMPWKDNANEELTAEDPERTENAEEEEESRAKIIVRSNGTVTYVGKDIAYQLWKFGLLGKDFHYRKWPDAPGGSVLWATTSGKNEPGAPHFGDATAVYNVIDARQAYLQEVVAEGLRALGYVQQAEHSVHFDYQIVALTPRCAAEMGYELSEEDAKRPYVEVSGRKGFGVKADDLITRMQQAAELRVREKQADMSAADLAKTANALAIGALRFFLLKYTRNTIIAFDFEDALKAEGETGPYCQYAVVRIRGIRRKGVEAGAAVVKVTQESAAKFLNGAEGSDLWELLLLNGSLDHAADAAIAVQEPAFVARYAFQLAQAFNNFYHRHHILSEADEQKRVFLLALSGLVETQLVRALGLLGIETPEKM
ncbi:MAG TPA: arginine--tRNA ligase [Candidatus Acidoferrum sp.]|nr:arginine--tRNA ligase [Candidatus Acidoferrum sp.]